MAQLSEQDAPDGSAAARRTKPPGKVSRFNLLNRISIQSKLILMLVLCTHPGSGDRRRHRLPDRS